MLDNVMWKNLLTYCALLILGIVVSFTMLRPSQSFSPSSSAVSSCSSSHHKSAHYLRDTEFFVVSSPQNKIRWKHLRSVLTVGSYGINQVHGCTSETKAVKTFLEKHSDRNVEVFAMVCSHYRAIEMAFKKNLDHAIIVEDDALPVPDFWNRLDELTRALSLTPTNYGVLMLQHQGKKKMLESEPALLVKRVVNEHHHHIIAKQFSREDLSEVGFVASGAYVISKKAMKDIVEYGNVAKWMGKSRGANVVSDASGTMVSWALENLGGYYSVPPLIFRCKNEGGNNKAGSINQEVEKKRSEAEKQKNFFASFLEKTGRTPYLPKWFLECGYEDNDPSLKQHCS